MMKLQGPIATGRHSYCLDYAHRIISLNSTRLRTSLAGFFPTLHHSKLPKFINHSQSSPSNSNPPFERHGDTMESYASHFPIRGMSFEVESTKHRVKSVQNYSTKADRSPSSVLRDLESTLGSPFSRSPQAAPHQPLVIVISGPSGVGKDAVIKKLQQVRRDLHFVVTATSRPKRPREVEGIDYFFVTKDKFQAMIEGGELLEHALVYGDYKGIPKKQVRDAMSQGTDVVLRVDVQGAATVRSILGSNAVFIFLVAESELALVKRLVDRKTESLEKALVRIQTARDELKRVEEFDYVVVNSHGKLEKAVHDICAIIDSEKCRVHPKVAVL